MALSDYDTLALCGAGACSGRLLSPRGIAVEVYKTWLYVRDPAIVGWNGEPGGPCLKIQHGELRYRDIAIHARRGPQEGVFALVSYGSPYLGDEPFDAMACCGVYGWEGDYPNSTYVGVTERARDFLQDMVFNTDERWVPDDHPLLNEGAWRQTLRFNQGDAFFQNAIDERDNTVALPATEPGQADTPLAIELLSALRADEADTTSETPDSITHNSPEDTP